MSPFACSWITSHWTHTIFSVDLIPRQRFLICFKEWCLDSIIGWGQRNTAEWQMVKLCNGPDGWGDNSASQKLTLSMCAEIPRGTTPLQVQRQSDFYHHSCRAIKCHPWRRPWKHLVHFSNGVFLLCGIFNLERLGVLLQVTQPLGVIRRDSRSPDSPSTVLSFASHCFSLPTKIYQLSLGL